MAFYRRAADAVRSLHLERPIHAVAGALCAVATSEPVFHLTFDDGPHPIVTPRVLDVLDEFGAKATFFILTQNAQAHPHLVHETIARGHEVALHTRTHPRLPDTPFQQLRDEIFAARADLEEVAGREIPWFRPPYGAHGLRSLSMVKVAGMKTLLWSVDSRDYKGLTPDDPLQRTKETIAPGGILLLHDIPVDGTLENDASKGYILKEDLTRAYLVELRNLGLSPVSLAQLLEAGSPVRKLKLG